MRRPWYSYVLLFPGILVLLNAAFGPSVGLDAQDPGGAAPGARRVVKVVRPGGPLDRAGVLPGDRLLSGGPLAIGEAGALEWKDGAPRAGALEVARGARVLRLDVRPVPLEWPVALAAALLRLLNVGLTSLALALFWQRPRDGGALLLGLVLLSAPVFVYPPGYRLLTVTLAVHFFTVFPPAPRRRLWLRTIALYAPFLFGGLIGAALADDGKGEQAAVLLNLLNLAYAGSGLAIVLVRGRRAGPAGRPVFRTLAVVAGAILAAVAAGLWKRPGATLLPAILFSAAIGHLVFRLRALEVKVMARRTLQYLLARWTLGTLFLIPGFVLVWRFGQLSVSRGQARPGEVLAYLLWMFLVALLLGKRQEVLRNLDRRFFQDVEATRQALIRLAQELGGRHTPESVLQTLEQGVRAALQPRSLHLTLSEEPAEPEVLLTVPMHRGETVIGYVQLGPRADGRGYTTEERELLETAAVQAATALENARLGAELLAGQRAELGARTAGVLAGAEEERRRLAADLHDQVLPELRQVAGEFESLRGRADGVAPELERLERDVRATMDSVREVMEALRPSALDVLGLPDALESYLRRGAARRIPPPAVTVRCAGEQPSLSQDESLALYRICQEAINNLLKHSGARRAGMDVRSGGGTLSLAIWDDGIGVDPDAEGRGGHGLGNIRYRADLIGARVSWMPREGGGTRFEVTLDVSGRETRAGPPPSVAPALAERGEERE